MVEDHEVELAPDQFESHVAAPLSPARAAGERVRDQFADRDRAEAQMHGKIRDALDRRVVASFGVVRDASCEVVSQARAPRMPGVMPRLSRFVGSNRARPAMARPLGRSGSTRYRPRVGASIVLGQAFQPGTLVRGENREGFAGQCQHLGPVKD